MVNFFKYILPKFYNKINLALRYLGRSTKGGERKLNLEVRDAFMHFPHRVRKLTRNTFSGFYSSACLVGDPSTGDASSERAPGSGSPSADISALGGRPPGPLTSYTCGPARLPSFHVFIERQVHVSTVGNPEEWHCLHPWSACILVGERRWGSLQLNPMRPDHGTGLRNQM